LPDKDFLVKFCQQREEEYDVILENYEERPTLKSSWEVAIAYFGTDSLYNAVTKKYGYQKKFPNDDEPLSMPEEVYKLVRDQDQNGEFFYLSEYDKDLVEEHIHQESFQEDINDEDLDEVHHPDEDTLVSMLPLDKDDIVQPCSPPTHEEIISLNDAYDLMQNLSDIANLHINDFIQVGRRRWNFGHFVFDRDPIYDIEGNSQEKWVKLSSS
jgi:hypothetical protein